MTGRALAMTERDLRICDEVRRFGGLTREQLQRLGLFQSPSRAKERLKRLVDHGVLTTRPHAVHQRGVRFVYLPGPAIVPKGTRTPQLSPLFVAHQLGLVDIRIAFLRHTEVERWLSDRDLAPMSLGFIPDGYVEYRVGQATFAAFIEYDRGTESLAHIEEKVKAYTAFGFSGKFEQRFGLKFFRLLLVADSRGRLQNLGKAAARVTDRVVRLAPLESINTHGPLARIWRRPGGQQFESLTA